MSDALNKVILHADVKAQAAAPANLTEVTTKGVKWVAGEWAKHHVQAQIGGTA